MEETPITLFPIDSPAAKPPKENPCVQLYGLGPAGQTCQDCTHLIGIGRASTHYKCDLRTRTSGAKTDHQCRWSACARFEWRVEKQAIPIYDGR